jgi:oxalate decarboxylase/phosphoglucose isomerase-like protein (cupin superfamily)
MAKAAVKTIEQGKTDRVRILDPFKNSRPLWLGLDEEGFRRKVFQIITDDTVGSQHLRAGLTIFEPGEQCAPHNHPQSEEINVALKGSGIAIDVTAGTESRFKAHDWIFIPKGHVHVHRNDGDEPLWLLWCYAPPGDLPTR